MSGRNGWHGIRTNTRIIMVMLMNNGYVTYYNDLEPNRVSPYCVRYSLECDFDLQSQLPPLADLDAIIADIEVLGTYKFEVESEATAHGVSVWPARGVCVKAPLPMPKRGTDTAHGEGAY